MARRKRASMREGPLADLFRSTIDDPPADPPEAPRPGQRAQREEAEQPTRQLPTQPPEPAEEPTVHLGESAREAPAEPEPPAPPSQERRPYDEEREAPPPATPETGPSEGPSQTALQERRERLRNIFGEEPARELLDTPSYTRPSSYEAQPHSPVIRVVGVGGAGVNAVNRMVDAQIPGVEFMAINTDLQSLQVCIADVTVHIGGDQTRGLGTGADPEAGYRAAFDEQDKIKRLLKGSDMVFVAAGAGGGTGTGAAPVIARLAHEVGALTVGIITKPFAFEGTRRATQASKGIEALAQEVDTLIIVPNDRLLEVLDERTTMVEAFQVADDVLRQGVQGVSDLVTLPALINLDFADVRTIMSEAGQALLGIGMGTGEGRAAAAARKAISSPLLETSVEGARSILLSITGGPDLSLVEVSEAANVVGEAAHDDANIIFGANIDPDLQDQVWVTVVATRFDGRTPRLRRSERSEPGVRRAPKGSRRQGGRSSGDFGIEVPEFVPGG